MKEKGSIFNKFIERASCVTQLKQFCFVPENPVAPKGYSVGKIQTETKMPAKTSGKGHFPQGAW